MKTAECVTPMHPDKICDRISDAILDACLEQDPESRVAIETMGGHGIITITGELTTKAYINVREIAQRIAGTQYGVQTNIVTQSPEIAQGVDTGGAGDQGIMVGYACNDNADMIPNEVYLSRSLAKHLYAKYPYDGKTQITLNDDGEVSTIVASFQNVPGTALKVAVYEWIENNNIETTLDLIVHANPAGDWNQGGFEADTGLTGRKLMVDNYGPRVAIGGGAFSGKDSTKVDRSAAYMARKIAVDILRSNNAKVVKVTLAYAIGVANPVMVDIIAAMQDGTILDSGWDMSKYDLTPKGIKTFLKLTEPQFEKTAVWGHFGNGFNWDK